MSTSSYVNCIHNLMWVFFILQLLFCILNRGNATLDCSVLLSTFLGEFYVSKSLPIYFLRQIFHVLKTLVHINKQYLIKCLNPSLFISLIPYRLLFILLLSSCKSHSVITLPFVGLKFCCTIMLNAEYIIFGIMNAE